ncbi:MAG: hypothetical protein K8T91_10245 [Planctomycetes bacterium]|nr:hypothetical protein [Planctomycetota bacterium]
MNRFDRAPLRKEIPMKKWIVTLLTLAICTSDAGAEPKARPKQQQKPKTPAAVAKPKEFKILDNMKYKGQPDLTQAGLIHCNIIYQEAIWKNRKVDQMPDKEAYLEVVRRHVKAPGFVVLDIENSSNYKHFATLVRWTKEAAPGSLVGMYGHGTETQELAKAVDAFFPSMYTFDDNREQWKRKMQRAVNQSRGMAPGKPVYPYLWPQYHKGAAREWQFIGGDYWMFQLRTARECGANGVVLWGNSTLKGVAQPAWRPNAPWWQSTVKFAAEIK